MVCNFSSCFVHHLTINFTYAKYWNWRGSMGPKPRSAGFVRFWLPGSGFMGQNINRKLKKTFFTLNPQNWSIERRKISWFLNGSSSFSIKISEKIKQKIWKFSFVKRNSKSWRNCLDPAPFFQWGSRIRIWIGITINWILSTGKSYELLYLLRTAEVHI